MSNDRTDYSDENPGSAGNYNWSVRIDKTGGHVGITQSEKGRVKDRVLLSPKQVKALIEFVQPKAKRAPSKRGAPSGVNLKKARA